MSYHDESSFALTPQQLKTVLLRRSRMEAEAKVPAELRGWTIDDYWHNARKLAGMVGVGEKPGIIAAIQRGDTVPEWAVKLAIAQYRKHGQTERANALEAAWEYLA